MRYEKQTVLTRDENPFGGKDYDVDPFMVGDLKVLSWKEEDSRGVESHSIRPAYSASPDFAESSGRCWYHVWSYEATERGNQSRGYGAELMPFLEGVTKLVERDVFSFRLPESKKYALVRFESYDDADINGDGYGGYTDEWNAGLTRFEVDGQQVEYHVMVPLDLPRRIPGVLVGITEWKED